MVESASERDQNPGKIVVFLHLISFPLAGAIHVLTSELYFGGAMPKSVAIALPLIALLIAVWTVHRVGLSNSDNLWSGPTSLAGYFRILPMPENWLGMSHISLGIMSGLTAGHAISAYMSNHFGTLFIVGLAVLSGLGFAWTTYQLKLMGGE